MTRKNTTNTKLVTSDLDKAIMYGILQAHMVDETVPGRIGLKSYAIGWSDSRVLEEVNKLRKGEPLRETHISDYRARTRLWSRWPNTQEGRALARENNPGFIFYFDKPEGSPSDQLTPPVNAQVAGLQNTITMLRNAHDSLAERIKALETLWGDEHAAQEKERLIAREHRARVDSHLAAIRVKIRYRLPE